ncbi:MAG: YggS family pyridoxal phosphate-dependent enzyme [Gammaproteobacteria bacterium]|nr:YggS family pyridoxal phosphate-dependent enzyme [Gammaproteobacteria bacterium]MDP6097039.1 YggS family pyridoxal phosphate-dependent enzyme [Gammaproteobacteria bacterium]HJO11142.1 YggS family pyridoxal phosphate-dependent enzyme [Gammaproteobacteria bacterium]
MPSIAENIVLVCERIRYFEQQYGRPAKSVKLLAVSKKQDPGKLREAFAAGITDFGENYLQEAQVKMKQLSDLQLVWHFIGPIQANKTRGLAEHFHWIHSVDRLKIAHRLSEQRLPNESPLNICVQVNLSREESKSGTTLEQATALCDVVETLPHLKLRGLMAIPEALSDKQQQRASFADLAAAFHRLAPDYACFDTLSIGMSNDFEAAIAEGSSMVRIGTAIFGPRTN